MEKVDKNVSISLTINGVLNPAATSATDNF